jgi:ribulose-phosphate 3-epimerase
MNNYRIAPSLLAADFARLGEEAQAVVDAGADLLHLDVMDNHFVPNLTLGPRACEALRQYGIKTEINVHLMAKPIDRLIVDFANAGASSIIFHSEATENIDQTLHLIHELGCKAGIALKPETSLLILETILPELDYILVMSVHPGFGGQEFIPATFEKISKVRNLILQSGQAIFLGVDGGINMKNIAHVAEAGADTFVAGTAIFNTTNYAKSISLMRQKLSAIK